MSKQSSLDLLSQLEQEHNVDVSVVENFIEELESRIEDLEEKEEDLVKKVSKLEDELDEANDLLEEANAKVDESLSIPDGVNRSIILDGALKDLLDNLHRIPAIDIQSFVDKYAV